MSENETDYTVSLPILTTGLNKREAFTKINAALEKAGLDWDATYFDLDKQVDEC